MNGLDSKMGGSSRSRRSFLRAAGTTALATSLAGCSAVLGDAGLQESDDGPVAVASFFSFYDFARHVADGTSLTVENLVPVGMHGHGWEPDASITRDIVDADVFVHVGEDFQPWADRAIQTVKDDGADTALLDVREGIDLIDLDESVGEEEAVAGSKDPHFWLDPHRAKKAVDNVVEGFVEVVPEEEDRFRENGEAYRAELDEIDAEYASIFEDSSRRVVFLAAHNAFQYLGVRYDVEMHPLVFNLAANDQVKPSDVTRAKGIIDENDIQYIGAAVFESLRPARQLLDETAVEAYFPVTPYAGIRPDWVEAGWGYTEIAREINMPTFEVVLGNATPEEVDHEEWRNFEATES